MLIRLFGYFMGFCLTLAAIGGFVAGVYLWRLNKDLPDHDHLADYAPPIMTRIHAGDGDLIAEFAQEPRIFVPINVIPQDLINAFLSAEDKNFYNHSGIDMTGVMRAVINNVFNVMQGRRLEGASTITQQVAKNFLLTSDVTFERKLKEAVLALRLERTFSKEELLELYLNEIYLGMGTYGVAAASLVYFDKPLNELTIDEMAFLAALPKAPNNYHPIRRKERAMARRNWVVGRMVDNGFIETAQAEIAKKRDLITVPRRSNVSGVDAQYFVEAVRRQLYQQYGEDTLYGGGLSVRSTINTNFQAAAHKALRKGLVDYDRRHGWRGPVAKAEEIGEDWAIPLQEVDIPSDLAPWRLAIVLSVTPEMAEIGLRPRRTISGQFESNRETGRIALADLKWARKAYKKGVGPRINAADEVLSVGDMVWVEQHKSGTADYKLQQLPEVNGGLVAVDPHTGRVLAMVGGFSFRDSEFNRTTQANRQPGSAFKPFVYAAALDRGYTPTSLVLDAPFVIEQGRDMGLWKPENYGRKFYGLSTLRLGIEKSRNLMTVRLAQQIGMRPIVENAKQFGITDHMPPVLSMALGAGETNLLKMTMAYAMLVNGGKYVEPVMIDRIQDRYGKTIFKTDNRYCEGCLAQWTGQDAPDLQDNRREVVNPQTAYQVVSMLEGVVIRGTGRSIRSVGKPLAGKTGTTNDSRDAWFIGFSPDLAVGVYVGYDTPKTLGEGETGGRVAAPIFRNFMSEALKNAPSTPFRIPPSVKLVRVNGKTGELAKAGDRSVVLEAFKPGTEPAPGRKQAVIGMPDANPQNPAQDTPELGAGTGGLY